MAETLMTSPRGQFELTRRFTPASSPLRAWSAADQLVLDDLGTDDLGRVLIVNDEFGALTVALSDADVTTWTDSALSRDAIAANLELNDKAPLAAAAMVPGDQPPTGPFDTIVVRIPKTSALLDYQLGVARSVSTASTRVVGTGMVRHIHSSTVAAFEKALGDTTTSRATRKARLIHSRVTSAETGPIELPSTSFSTADAIEVTELPGTFSAGHLDIGTALLLDVLADVPAPAPHATVVDLGCGNGVIAATLAKQWAGADFMLVDASDLAVAAAQRTWAQNDLGDRVEAYAADGLTSFDDDSVDAVVTNPPFHQGHALDRDLTDRLLADAARILRASGVAYVVVQRHHKLYATMARWFGSVEVISKHPSHVVLEARSPLKA